MGDKCVPKVRFRGFSEEWERRRLGDVFNEYSEKNHEELPTLMIVQGKGTIRRNDSDRNLQYDVSNLSNYKLVRENDFIVHLRSFEGGLEKANCQGIMSPAYHIFHGEKVDPNFYYEYFRSYNFINIQLQPHVYGIRDGRNIDIDGMKTIRIPFTTMEEQSRIGGFFSSLNNLITLHQLKCEKLKVLKEAMLDRMFPKNGQKIPEIRFSGFSGEWEQYKLGDIVQITMGQSPDGSTYSEEPSDYILVQGNADLQNGWVCPRVWTSQMTKKADAGDLIMSVRAPAGTMGKTAYSTVIGRGVAAIKGNEFIFQSLLKMDSDGFWRKLTCGSTFESLNSNNIKNAEVFVPSKSEQNYIGTIFRNLDYLISFHRHKYEKLKLLKQAMLEKMFI